MITIEELTYRYKNSRAEALRNLSVGLEGGHIYGLLGKNGEGKSTLLKILSGLLHPRQGRVMVNGYNPGDRKVDFLANLFFLPEEFGLPRVKAAQYKALTAPFYPKFSDELFCKALDEFELDPGKLINRYSFGQRKKFLIAFGLATNSGLLLLDEPTNGLDIPSKAKLRKLLSEAMTPDRLCIISTHQARDLESIMDSIIVLNEGKLAFNSSVEAINQQFIMARSDESPVSGAVYSEATADGFVSLVRCRNNDRKQIDLELLFSAIIGNPSLMDNDGEEQLND